MRKVMLILLIVFILSSCSQNNKTEESTVSHFMAALIAGDSEKIGKLSRLDEAYQKELITMANQTKLINASLDLCTFQYSDNLITAVLCTTNDDKKIGLKIQVNEEKDGFYVYNFEYEEPIKIDIREVENKIPQELIKEIKELIGVELTELSAEDKEELMFVTYELAHAFMDLIYQDPQEFKKYWDVDFQIEGYSSSEILAGMDEELKRFMSQFEGLDDVFEGSGIHSIEIGSNHDFLLSILDDIEDENEYAEFNEEFYQSFSVNLEELYPIQIILEFVDRRSNENIKALNSFVLSKKNNKWSIPVNPFSLYAFEYIDQSLYYGEWKNGQRHGRGKGAWPELANGIIYDGEWLENTPHGFGEIYKFYFVNRDNYIDYYRSSLLDPFPFVSTKLELEYKGDMVQGKREGLGVVYVDGTPRFEGTFEQDSLKFGKEYDPEGNLLYEGEFEHDRYHGSGTEYSADGTLLYQGLFENGDYVGPEQISNNISVTSRELINDYDGSILHLPIVEGSVAQNVLKKINDQLNQEYIRAKRGIEDNKPVEIRGHLIGGFYMHYDVTFQSDEFLSIVIHWETERNYGPTGYNFRLSDGENVGIDRFLNDKNISLDTIEQRVISSFNRQNIDSHFKGFDKAHDVKFHLTNQGLVILFDRYEVTQIAGDYNVPLSWRELKK